LRYHVLSRVNHHKTGGKTMSEGWDYHIDVFTVKSLSDLEIQLRQFGVRQDFTQWELASVVWPANTPLPKDVSERVDKIPVVCVFKSPLS
jgi:hypothetical protein